MSTVAELKQAVDRAARARADLVKLVGKADVATMPYLEKALEEATEDHVQACYEYSMSIEI